MTLLVPLLLAIALVIVTGSSLRRRRQWSRGQYLLWVVGGTALTLLAAALVFLPRRALP